MKKETLVKLATEINNPCVTISMNTHRTHPDNTQDIVGLKNLLKEAKQRVITEFGKRFDNDLLEKIDNIDKEIDVNYNLDSLHIFLSNSTKEIIKSPWKIAEDTVSIGEGFAVKPLIKLFNRTEEYLILVLSQSGVKLVHAVNDAIISEIENDDFPFSKNPHFITDNDKISFANEIDNMVREYFNEVDKALVKVHNQTSLNCIAICTENNYSRLLQVADKPSIYIGHAKINYNETSNSIIIKDAWEIIKTLQEKNRKDAIHEMEEAVGLGNVITDLADIYRAAKDGSGDLLITHNDYKQAVKMTGDYTFDLVDDNTLPGIIDDISSEIAWEVISKKGRAIFTSQEEIKSLGEIVLKVRY